MKLLLSLAIFSSLLLAGCGLITMPASLPAAFAENGNLGLRGNIVDDEGRPVDQVLVHPEREYYLWHADGNYMEYLTDAIQSMDHEFNIPTRRAHKLVFTFKKTGYRDQAITIDTEGIQTPACSYLNGNRWPADSAVTVVMVPADRPIPRLLWLDTIVDYTDPAKVPAMDLSQAAPSGARSSKQVANGNGVRVLDVGQEVPAGMMYAAVERQALRTRGPNREVDPMDINMPARVALKLSGIDGGIIAFTPTPGSDVLQQMAQAPETGYVQQLLLEEPQLKMLRDSKRQLVTERNVFFFFRTGTGAGSTAKYGKGVMNWSTGGKGDALALRFTLIVQPDGTRNLLTAGM